ncbi:MAG: T9SS C-terminal target domain-containing protein [Bacteroidetes bacterium]|nr:MAG: T9SS C-terminal target domain-containing protein [Bacteroidota bacterium]
MRFLFTFIFFLALGAPVWGQTPEQVSGILDGEMIVRLRAGVAPETLVRDLNTGADAAAQWRVLSKISDRLNAWLLGFEERRLDKFAARARLEARPEVVYAEFNFRLQSRLDSVPDDPLFGGQWDMELIELPRVWAYSTGGTSARNDEIVVAILDSGFDIEHIDLADRIWTNAAEIPGNNFDDDLNDHADDLTGWNFKNNTPNHPIESHGTSVAGIVGAAGNNGEGIAGVNWKVKILPVTVGTSAQVAAGYEYVADLRKRYNDTGGAQGAFVVATNTSLGFDKQHCDEHPLWRDVYEYTGQVGILNAAATANDNLDVEVEGDMPTSCTTDFLITVTNTNRKDAKVENAAFGVKSIDLGAPGDDVPALTPFNQYKETFGGTSAATPHVAGAIGLLYAFPCEELIAMAFDDPPAAALLVKEALLASVDPLPDLAGKTVTGGRLNVYQAMRYLHGYCIATPEERDARNFEQKYLLKKAVIRLFPNPVKEALTFEYSTEDFGTFEIQIFNAMGQMMYRQFIESVPFSPQLIILDDVRHWPAGTYFLNVVSPTEKITAPFIKGL